MRIGGARILVAAILLATATVPASAGPAVQTGFAVLIQAPDTFSAGIPVHVTGWVLAVVGLPVVVEVAEGVPNFDVELVLDGAVVAKTKTTLEGFYQFDVLLGTDPPTTHLIRTVVMRGIPVLESSSQTVATSIDRFFLDLRVQPSPAEVTSGGSLALRACGEDNFGRRGDATEHADWSTSNPAFATVSNAPGSKGVVSGISPGTATITATVDGLTASSTVQVVEGPGSATVPCPTDP